MLDTIHTLQSDINAFRNMILYYEGRILRKEIAIAELVSGNQCQTDQQATACLEAAIAQKLNGNSSVRQYIEESIPLLGKEIFNHVDLKDKILELHPNDLQLRDKVVIGIKPACQWLVESKRLVRCENGGMRLP